MKDLTPKGCSNTPCPFMTDGDEIGGKNSKKIKFKIKESSVSSKKDLLKNYSMKLLPIVD
jgi:hypothetical protein